MKKHGSWLIFSQGEKLGYFSSGPVAKTPCSQHRGPQVQSLVKDLDLNATTKNLHATTKDTSATTKIWPSQIYKYFS